MDDLPMIQAGKRTGHVSRVDSFQRWVLEASREIDVVCELTRMNYAPQFVQYIVR
jgi:hypothetical protein